jgi:excinuclease ABC subunit C
MFDFKEEIKNLPIDPGVYFMFDKNDTVIYVGKAKVLKNRVSQYFHNSASHAPKVRAMVSHVARFSYIVCDSEKEALALECNMIKHYKPRYNILLKDDKHYPYIKITMQEDWPKITATRRQEKDGAKYFGPYQSMDIVRRTIDVVRSIFKIPTCTRQFPRDLGKNRPCLNYQMGKCFAPCSGKIEQEEYRQTFSQICSFLGGKHDELIREYETIMRESAQKMEFEKAASYRDKLAAIRSIEDKQKVILTGNEEQDVIACAVYDDMCFAEVFFVRGGRTVGRNSLRMDGIEGVSEGELLSTFLKQFYAEVDDIPREILLPSAPDDSEELEDWLSDKRYEYHVREGMDARCGRVHFVLPQIGEKAKMIRMVEKNAQISIDHYKLDKLKQELNNKTLDKLAACLGLSKPPRRIEAYDISNISGSDTVGAMVVYINGKPDKKEFRRFQIKTVEGQDDYASTEEMLVRRFTHEAREDDDRFSDMPDLILMDGGLGHVHTAKKVLNELELLFPIFGMAKDDRHKTRALVDENGNELQIPQTSSVFHLLGEIQEQVHKYAIDYHRNLRKKKMTKSKLDEINGVGEKRKKALMKHFKSIKAIENASFEELSQVPGIDRGTAQKIYSFFHSEGK